MEGRLDMCLFVESGGFSSSCMHFDSSGVRERCTFLGLLI